MVRPAKEPELTQVHPQAAGIDIGGSEHWVSIPAELDPEPVRKFSCFTADGSPAVMVISKTYGKGGKVKG